MPGVKLNTAVLKEAMVRNGQDIQYLSARIDQHAGPVSVKLFRQWLDGRQQPSREQLSYLANMAMVSREELLSNRQPTGEFAGRKPVLDLYATKPSRKKSPEPEPSWKPFVNLLKTGLFHQTTPERLKAIIQSGHILPSGSTPESTWPGLKTYSAAISAVALFDFGRATDREIRGTKNCWLSVVAKNSRSVLLRLSPSALTTPLEHYQAGMRRKIGAVQLLDYLESWHKGPIPWGAVDGCWELRIEEDGPRLTDLTHLFPSTNALLRDLHGPVRVVPDEDEVRDEWELECGDELMALAELQAINPGLEVMVKGCFGQFSREQLRLLMVDPGFWEELQIQEPSGEEKELVLKTVPAGRF